MMQGIKERLQQLRWELEQKYRPPEMVINQLKSEGKSMGQIEQEILNMNRILGVYDSIVTALRILGS